MLKNKIHIASFSWTKFVLIVIIIVLAVISLKQYSTNKDFNKKLKLNNEARKDTIEHFQNNEGLWVAEKKAFQTTIKEMNILIDDILHENEQLSTQIKSFKKPTSASSNTTKVSIEKVDVKFTNPVDFKFDREFQKITTHYNLYGKVNQFGIYDFRFLATNNQTLVTGIKKTGLFSTDFTSELINSNPIFLTSDMTNIDFTENQKRFSIAVFSGYVIPPNLKPTFAVGVGVSYHLIQF